MSYEIRTLPVFDKEIKRLAKKYVSLKSDYQNLLRELYENPLKGIALGNQCYKIRMAISAKGKGKSGGARVVYYIQVNKTTIYLLTIFDKSDQENLPESEIKKLLSQIS